MTPITLTKHTTSVRDLVPIAPAADRQLGPRGDDVADPALLAVRLQEWAEAAALVFEEPGRAEPPETTYWAAGGLTAPVARRVRVSPSRVDVPRSDDRPQRVYTFAEPVDHVEHTTGTVFHTPPPHGAGPPEPWARGLAVSVVIETLPPDR